jgi:RNA polymerase sigma factor for flagellar operon FliA
MSGSAPYGSLELARLAAEEQLRSATGSERDAGKLGQAVRQDAEAVLWERYRSQGDLEARERLIMLHLPYAKAVAAGLYSKHVHHEAAFEDYLQWATVGMIEALDRYDPSRGAQFRTYAHTRMQGAIRDGLEHISDRQEQISLHRKLIAERVAAVKGGAELDSSSRLLETMAEVSMGMILSFMLDDTGMIMDESSSLPNQCYEQLEFKQEKARIHSLLGQLTERQQAVIRMHYLQGLTYELIAQTLGISRPRIAQLHAQALQNLRKLFTASLNNAANRVIEG